MTFHAKMSDEAERNIASCYNYILSRSEAGAHRWANAFYQALKDLEQEPRRGRAPEDAHHDEAIRQMLFKTRSGRTYRALFVIREESVLILHIRGPGQDIMQPDEIVIPDDSVVD